MNTKPNNQNKGKILIVDDLPENLRLLSNMLMRRGYSVRAMASGERAIDSVNIDKPDIILLDVNMPGMNGYEVCKRLKDDEHTRAIPIIFISALDELDSKIEAFRAGGVDYITKPFQIEEVIARIETHFSLLRTSQELQRSEEQFRLLAENAQDIVFRYRFQSPRGFEYISPAVQEITGYTPEEYYADPDFDLKRLHPDSLPQLGVFMESPDSYREPIIMRYLRKDGGDVWLEQNHRVIHDDEGRPIAIEGISRDITERKRAEQKLKIAYQDVQVLNKRLQDELQMARTIQQNLLPSAKPNWVGLDVKCYTMPASEIGGDLYSYYTFHFSSTDSQPEKYALAVGDISGKGMPAALLMAISLGLVRSTMSLELSPSDALSYLNEALMDYTYTTRQNCALVYAEIVLFDSTSDTYADDTSRLLLRVANAGCITPIIRRKDGTIEWVDVGGIPLGIEMDGEHEYEEQEVFLDTGDVIIFTSDGVVEAKNNEGIMFGFHRLEEAIVAAPATKAEVLLNYLRSSLEQFVAGVEPHDDVTIVVVKV